MKKENETADVLETEKSGKKKSRLPKPVRLLILIVGTAVGALAITPLWYVPLRPEENATYNTFLFSFNASSITAFACSGFT